jgi:hypothetical protein
MSYPQRPLVLHKALPDFGLNNLLNAGDMTFLKGVETQEALRCRSAIAGNPVFLQKCRTRFKSRF